MKRFSVTTAVAALALAAGCGREPTAPTAPVIAPNFLIGPVTTISTIVRPAMQGGAANNLASVALDPAPSYSVGSVAANATVLMAKSEMYFTPEGLFGGREVAVGDVANLSYWTKTGATHAVDPRDWYLVIYTKRYTGQVGTSFYGTRIGSEPYFSENPIDPASTWNQWLTDGTNNHLRFFESTYGYFGSYTDPHLTAFASGTSLAGTRGPGVSYATQPILYFSIQTGSAWANGFTGQVDGLRIELTDGSVATVNFEPDLPACTTVCYADAVSGNNANGGASAADAKKTIQAAINQVSSGGEVRVLPGTYPEQVVVNKDITVKGAGQAQTLLIGSACTGNGISLGSAASGATVQDLGISGFNLGIQILTGPLSNITVQDVTSSSNCLHGIWVQAFGTTNFAFTRVTANSNGIGAGGRGIWMINGVRDGISITDGHYNSNGLVGIDLSDGSATNVTITGNAVVGNKDSGIGVLGAMGPGANLVSNNTVTDNGRYGIEMKIPTGNGALSGAGSVVVSNNVVTRTGAAIDVRDYAGIAVFRRSVDPLLNADQPTGVVVTGNSVSGFLRRPSASTGDGFGIVVEGTGHIVTKNLVSGNDIGIQIQSGNTANVQSTPYFDRGDAAPSSALINRNSITSNIDFDLRNVGAGLTDATCNWYGSATGPVAGKVLGSFTTTQWLTTSNLNGGCPDNQGPLTSLTPPAPAPINTAILLGVSISDLTTGNSPLLSYTWSRDGGTPTTVLFATSAVIQSFTINVPADIAADVDNICVKGTDAFGNIGPEVCVLAVWYDPTAGFVTGGGWINSPIGAYTTDPLLTGRANFGFVSKYQKGKTVPSGNTEFQFQAANLNFKSTAFDWLVVSGARAQYKGVGTINGAGNYSFILTAIDGQTAGGGGTDKFRMKIWDSSNLVYDNMLNAPDTSDPTTVLGGGNIMIHK